MTDPVTPTATPVTPPADPAAISTPATPAAPVTPSVAPVIQQQAKPAAPVAPTEYKLSLPNDGVLTNDHLNQVIAYSKEKGLSQEQAQEVLQNKHTERVLYNQELNARIQSNKEKWYNDFVNDKVMGGENAGKNAELAKRYAEQNFSEELRTFLHTSGYGNHPEFIKLVLQAARNTGNDTTVLGATGAMPKALTFEERLYKTGT